MKFLRNAFELYINSSIHVALAVVAFTIVTFLEYKLTLDNDLLFFIFFATITGYNFVKYAGIAKLHHSSLAGNLKFIQLLSLASFLALIYFIFLLSYEVLIATSILGAFTLFYAIPVFGKGRNLRSLSGLKIYIIALVWAGSTVILPLINAEKVLNISVIVDFLERFCLMVVLILPFELRDFNFDAKNLGTIPQKLGITQSKVFGTILLILIAISSLIQKDFESKEFIATIIILVLTGALLWKSGVNQNKYYASFWVEGLPILYLIVYAVLEFNFLNIPA